MDQVRLTPTGAIIELMLLSASRGRLRYRVVRAGREWEQPDAVARRLAGISTSEGAGLLHSTSWRFEGGRIVLTYVALPDPTPSRAGRPVPRERLSTGTGPLAPSPEQVSVDEVASHACRHLAFLRRTDPLVAERAGAAPGLWALIDEFVPAVAGLLHQPMEPAGRLVSVVE